MPLLRILSRPLLPVLVLFLSHASSHGAGVDHRESFRLLPPDRELLYLPAKYAPCFRCHPAKSVIEDEDFNVETNFRDTVLGKNLHSLHVYRQPHGTNCPTCHRVDPETGKVSIFPEVKLEMSDRGGACAPACHRPKKYENAGRKR
ncbi:MAG: hypothetical protein HZB86_10185 [Deltaproteobacteria bacterium]|nr:hypothetical protein [Deltaproteobacteria bacterium]